MRAVVTWGRSDQEAGTTRTEAGLFLQETFPCSHKLKAWDFIFSVQETNAEHIQET